MMYVFLGYYNKYGGYASILEQLAYGLVERGHTVKILGIKYDKSAHNHPFSIIPIEKPWIMEALRYVPEEFKADRVIIAADIPILHDIAVKFEEYDEKQKLWKFEALYPVESDPILSNWRRALSQYKARYVISRYGTDLCNSYGLNSSYFPVGCMVGNNPEYKSSVRRHLGWGEDKVAFLTVAGNFDRKAIPVAIEAYSKMEKEYIENSDYYIVTMAATRVGWDLQEYIDSLGMSEHVHIVRSGVSVGELSMMYWASNALVVPSQAEGACLPIFEAASHGLPVICGDWTGMHDFVDEDWMFPIGSVAEFVHPWGNTRRWIASASDICNRMQQMIFMKDSPDYTEICNTAIAYAKSRNWKDAVDIIEKGVDDVQKS